MKAVFSPTYGSVWYNGGAYTVQWMYSSLPTIDIDLLIKDASNVVVRLAIIAHSVPNNGSYTWVIPSNIVATNGYYMTVRPPGSTSYDGYSRSPVFSIQPQPTGPCPAGSTSPNGTYPDCVQCSKGFYVRTFPPL